MTVTADDLYELLPAVHRIRDADPEQRGVLEALVAVLARQADVVDEDIERLWDNWFVETCDPWVVPYIGDLLRVRSLRLGGSLRLGRLSPTPPGRFTLRSYVANTLAYRRGKGTVAVLEQLASDVTGWRARAVEFFRLLETTQHVNHLRSFNVRTPDLRATAALELEGGPFDRIAHTAEVRPVEVRRAADPIRTPIGRGRYNIPNVGLYLWRLQAYPVSGGTARPVSVPDAGHTFSPLGADVPLFNSPEPEDRITHLAQEIDVPTELRRRALYDELEARRQAVVDQSGLPPDRRVIPKTYFRDDRPVLRVFRQTAPDPAPMDEVSPDEILVCDLSGWGRPPGTKEYRPAGGGPPQTLPIGVAVDPTLGRLAFPAGIDPVRVNVSYAYGFGGDVGGGPYDRRDGVSVWLEPDEVTFQIGVTKDPQTLADAADPTQLVTTLRDAVGAWNAHAATRPDAFGLITVMDSATYPESLTGTFVVEVPEGCRLAFVAADWPQRPDPSAPAGVSRRRGDLAADLPLRAHVAGDVSARGTAGVGSIRPGAVFLDGLLVEGTIRVLAGNLGGLRLIDTTVVPGVGSVAVNPSAVPGQTNADLAVRIDRTICGPVSLPESVATLHVGSSIVDGKGGAAIDAPGADADIQRSTVFGSTSVRTLEAGNDVFTGPVVVERHQAGCVRFSVLPTEPPTRTPRRHRCQPDLALAGLDDPLIVARRRAELVPAFTADDYGRPGYAQLGPTCAEEIRTGAEDGSEMGVFNSLMQPQREANLRTALDEYLRFGLAAGVFFVT